MVAGCRLIVVGNRTLLQSMKKRIFIISVLFNVIFLFLLLLNWFNAPTYDYGKLKEDVEIGVFMSDGTVFKIPGGITVQDVSPRGIDAIGRFENNRFSLIITADEELVDYDVPKDSLSQFGNTYSVKAKSSDDR